MGLICSKWKNERWVTKLFTEEHLPIFGDVEWAEWKEPNPKALRRYRVANILTEDEEIDGRKRYSVLDYDRTNQKLTVSFPTENSYCD